jgi:2-pyrone-4,6-dicarboxylate lactonase
MISNGDRFSVQGFPWDDSIPFAQAFLEAAPDRTIWCADWPHVRYRREMPNDADLLELLYRCVPDADLRRKVLADNPARIFKFQD